jgi:hypothetical protein
MASITQTVTERKADDMQIIKDASHNRFRANPKITIRESFESRVQLELNLAYDTSSQ